MSKTACNICPPDPTLYLCSLCAVSWRQASQRAGAAHGRAAMWCLREAFSPGSPTTWAPTQKYTKRTDCQPPCSALPPLAPGCCFCFGVRLRVIKYPTTCLFGSQPILRRARFLEAIDCGCAPCVAIPFLAKAPNCFCTLAFPP